MLNVKEFLNIQMMYIVKYMCKINVLIKGVYRRSVFTTDELTVLIV